MAVQERIANYIDENGIKQIFISEKTGIEPSKLSNILNGNRKLTADELEKICLALKREPSDFMKLDED